MTRTEKAVVPIKEMIKYLLIFLPNIVMISASLLADRILRRLFFDGSDLLDGVTGFKQFLALRILCFIFFIYNISKLIITAVEVLISRYSKGKDYLYSDKFGILVTLRKASFSMDRDFVKQYFIRLTVFLLICGLAGTGLFFSSFSKLCGKNIYDQILLISDAEADERMNEFIYASSAKDMILKTCDNAYILQTESDDENAQCILSNDQYELIQTSESENFEVKYYTNSKLIAEIKPVYINGLFKEPSPTHEDVELPVEITLEKVDGKVLVVRPEMGNLEGRLWWYVERDGKFNNAGTANQLYMDELTYKRKGVFKVTLVMDYEFKNNERYYTAVSNTVVYDANCWDSY